MPALGGISVSGAFHVEDATLCRIVVTALWLASPKLRQLATGLPTLDLVYHHMEMKLTVSHATRPKLGESVNGDAIVVRSSDSHGLFAVVDALGHGPTAADVAKRATQYLESVSLDGDIRDIVTGLHRALHGSRGAAAMVCAIHANRLEGCGVGNVELRTSASEVPVVLSPGVLGGTVRSFRVFCGKLHSRSRIVLFSDGISSRFQLDSLRNLRTQEVSDRLLQQHGRAYDDATALVVDYEG